MDICPNHHSSLTQGLSGRKLQKQPPLPLQHRPRLKEKKNGWGKKINTQHRAVQALRSGNESNRFSWGGAEEATYSGQFGGGGTSR